MSPIDKLRHGIERGDWSIVGDAYHDLTGQRATPQEATPAQAMDVLNRVFGLIREVLFPGGSEPPPLAPSPPTAGKAKKKRAASGSPPPATVVDELLIEEDMDRNAPRVAEQPVGKIRGITQAEIDPVEVERNKKHHAKVMASQIRRPPPRQFSATCSACGENFTSLDAVPAGIGKRCPKCLKNRTDPADDDDDGDGDED